MELVEKSQPLALALDTLEDEGGFEAVEVVVEALSMGELELEHSKYTRKIHPNKIVYSGKWTEKPCSVYTRLFERLEYIDSGRGFPNIISN